ncbi:TetR/AcrR family transcriptional regulator [Gephyromycinifex aptenodytis]|uniref:TetR/AcrR family transcriptional regulator n=1 Tax=Gephyromycinifex aptenodytis TaxID=2716227 RepID=UPI001444B75A|nr:TetR/AcrR family transcriptional regulator [Gephyromycinifex aptenodytis]
MTSDLHLPRLVDPARLREPSTRRGERSRAVLVAAARRVFERDGYLEARLVDIAAEAGCAIGSFYTYFDSKDAAFDAVIHEVEDEILHPGPKPADTGDPVAVIRAGNYAYLAAYRRHARIVSLLDQAALVEPRWRELRARRRAVFVERNARSICDLQQRGLADPDLDADLAASALSSMVSRLAVHALAEADGTVSDADLNLLADTATRLWTNALGLTRPDLPTPTGKPPLPAPGRPGAEGES